jgi:zinc transport system substrate-binding protein
MFRNAIPVLTILFLSACADGGAAEGEACEVTADCADGLECHMHDGMGECHAEHGDDHDHDHDDTDHDHDHDDDHDDHDHDDDHDDHDHG